MMLEQRQAGRAATYLASGSRGFNPRGFAPWSRNQNIYGMLYVSHLHAGDSKLEVLNLKYGGLLIKSAASRYKCRKVNTKKKRVQWPWFAHLANPCFNSQGQGHLRLKLIAVERSYDKEYIHWIWELYVQWFKCYRQLNIFTKVGQRSRSQGQLVLYGWKGLATRMTHAKYESPMSNGCIVISK